MDTVVLLPCCDYLDFPTLYRLTPNLGIPVIGLVGNMTALRAPLKLFQFRDDEGNDVTEKVLDVVGQAFPNGRIISAVTEVFEAHGNGPEGIERKVGFNTMTKVYPKPQHSKSFVCTIPTGMAKSYSVPYLGSIPLDLNLMRACERGVSFTSDYVGSSAFQSFAGVVKSIVAFFDE